MPIYPLLKQSGFQPEHAKAMGEAFEASLADTGLKNRDDPLCQLIAKKIIELGQQGIHSPELLRKFALRDLGIKTED